MPVDPLELLEPIQGPNPAGPYLRDEPGSDGLTVYDKIKKARTEEVDSFSGERTPPDYGLVAKLATEALKSQSKDLQLAAWLAEALLKQDGVAGLRAGLDLIHGLLDKYWDHVHPELEDGDAEMRVAPLTWVGDYLDVSVRFAPLNTRGYNLFEYKEALGFGYEDDAKDDPNKLEARNRVVQEGKPTLEEFDQAFDSTDKPWYKGLVADVDGCLEAVGRLEDLGAERFGSDAPSYLKLRGGLSDVQSLAGSFLAKKLEIDPDPVEIAPVEDGAEETSGAPSDTKPLSAEPTDKVSAAAHIAAAARFLQRDDPTNPASYLMLRGYRWGELRAQGSQIDPRLLAAPPTNVRTRLKGFLLDAKWPELLAASEGVMATVNGRGWLDLQRYVLTALDALGAEYEHVVTAIRGTLIELLRDLPELPQLTLMDDTPTANAETRGWLRELLEAEESAAIPKIALADDEVEVVARGDAVRVSSKTIFDRAKALLRSGQSEQAIQLLMSQAEQERCARDRFLRRAEAADIMVETGHEGVAMPILKQLAEQVDGHRLEEWEAGETVARPLSLLYRCMHALGAESEDAQQALYLRVCRLDPMRAMSFPSSKQRAGSKAPDALPESSSDTPAAPRRIDANALLDQSGSSSSE